MKKLEADYMQVGHHGAAYNQQLFETVGADILFVDAPFSLRQYVEYPVYGNLRLLEEQGYDVYTYETTPNKVWLH